MPDYALPDLPYDYGALEYISGEIMELHHSKHHQTYVKGINAAVDQLAEARQTESFATLGTLEKNLAFHLGGHVNHSVFWPNMSPDGATSPTETSGRRSTSGSGRSTCSAHTSRRTHWRYRGPAGRSSPGT